MKKKSAFHFHILSQHKVPLLAFFNAWRRSGKQTSNPTTSFAGCRWLTTLLWWRYLAILWHTRPGSELPASPLITKASRTPASSRLRMSQGSVLWKTDSRQQQSFSRWNIFDALMGAAAQMHFHCFRPKFQSWVTRRAGPPTAGSGTSDSHVITSALAKAMQTLVLETLEVPCSQTGSGTDGKCKRLEKCYLLYCSIIELMCSGQSLGSRLTVSRAQMHNIPAFTHVLTDTWTGYPPTSRVWNRHKDQQGTLLPTKIVETREQSDLDNNIFLT